MNEFEELLGLFIVIEKLNEAIYIMEKISGHLYDLGYIKDADWYSNRSKNLKIQRDIILDMDIQ